MKAVRTALLLLTTVACTACLELTQEIWVNADGSGRMSFDVMVPEALLAMAEESEDGNPFGENQAAWESLKADPSQVPNLRSLDYQEYVEGEFHHFLIELEVDDATRLPETMVELEKRTGDEADADEETPQEPEAMTPPSDMRLEPLGGGKMLFVQTLVSEDIGDVERGESEEADAAQEAFLASMFAGKYYTVRLHAPKVNSTNGALDETTRTVEWKIPMADVMSQKVPQELRAEIEIDRQ